jgi:hypothetical protein
LIFAPNAATGKLASAIFPKSRREYIVTAPL